MNEKEHPFMNNNNFQPVSSKRLYFYEIELVIYFPSHGNDDGRSIPKYGVRYRDLKNKKGQSGRAINLEDVLALSIIKNGYPHTVCYFIAEVVGKFKYPPKKCLDLRTIQNEDDLYNWIKDLQL
ncbi:MAG: hypothetical protein Q7V05_11920 [Methanoregula sp.]|nr:hypothetical protein [Methanoregula sp.]